MHFTTKQALLHHGLVLVSHAVVKGIPALPVLAFIRLEVCGGRLKLSATNLEISITVWVEIEPDCEEGVIAVPAKRMIDLMSVAPDGKVQFQAHLERFAIAITYSCGRATFFGMSAEQFPQIPEPSPASQTIPLPVVALRKTIEGVSVAVADPKSAPNEAMTCILVQVSQEWVTFAAVDGKRVSYEDLPLLAEQATAFGTFLIPRRGLSELASVLPKEGAISMSLNANKSQVIFATPTFSLAVILVSGGFPNYRSVIPKSRPTRITVKTTEFIRIAKLTQVFAEGNKMAIITMKKSRGLEPGSLSCASKVSEAGGNDNTIGAIVEGIEGETLQMAFNVTFLLDALQTITTPDVRLEIGFADAAKTPVPAGFMTPVGAPGSVHCFVPLKVNDEESSKERV